MLKFKIETIRDQYIIEASTKEEATKVAVDKENRNAKTDFSLPGEVAVTDVTSWEQRKRDLLPSPMIISRPLKNEIDRQIADDLISPEEFKLLLRR